MKQVLDRNATGNKTFPYPKTFTDDRSGPPLGLAPDEASQSSRTGGKLRGLRALVTNGEAEVGQAVTAALSREGARVVLVGPEESMVGEVSEERGAGAVERVQIDSTYSEACCWEAVRMGVDHLGGLDILVNNTTWPDDELPLLGLTDEILLANLRTKVFPLFYLTAAALPHLAESAAGSIIHTTGGRLTRWGVRVNAVAAMRSSMPGSPFNGERDDWRSQVSGQAMVPKHWIDCGDCYTFLASPSAHHLNGQVIQPNGAGFFAG